jgi:hypothetical protein
MTFGPGAVVDFRADGAPVSAMAAGLEQWDLWFGPPGIRNPQTIHEPRLERKLGVKGFRLPPVVDEEYKDKDGRPDRRSLIAVRFPDWLQCPVCDRIAPSRRWGNFPGRAYRFCTSCTARSPGQRNLFVVPVRFIMACRLGHIDEFPWHFWVGHKPGCPQRGFLVLKSVRPGLAGLILSCPDCRAARSMDGIFGADTLKGLNCHGRRPWLLTSNEPCNEKSRALQRGASNLYFPVIDSALSIPPWSDALQDAIGIYWNDIVQTAPEDRAQFIGMLARGALRGALEELKITPEELADRIEERVALVAGEEILDIRKEEYRQFTSRMEVRPGDEREFEIRNVEVPDALVPFFSHIARVVRLREVRAIHGFTRINPPGEESGPEVSPISVTRLEWLPAIEVRGEGIFLSFNQEALSRWEQSEVTSSRAASIDSTWRMEWRERYGEKEPPQKITPRFLLVHTFAHALMRQLTLECGYSGAALRERLYVSDDGMAGLLVYTATSDADGTLGGLQRQGEPQRILRSVVAAIQAMEWCSSDPLCIEGVLSAQDKHSIAACHACVLAPETACETFNRFLDRAALIGLPGAPGVGYFSSLIPET